jgi:hypothetical protein
VIIDGFSSFFGQQIATLRNKAIVKGFQRFTIAIAARLKLVIMTAAAMLPLAVFSKLCIATWCNSTAAHFYKFCIQKPLDCWPLNLAALIAWA